VGLARASLRGAALAGWLAGSPVAVTANPATCDPWPGEPEPLPTLEDRDPVRAEWASLRAKELARVALRFEKDDPLRAQQLWRRLLCMDPANDEALAGVMRARAVRVHRPELVDAPFAATRSSDAWEALDAPLGLRRGPTGDEREAAIQSEFRELRTAVGVLEAQVRAAQFEEALANAPDLRARLARTPAGGTRASLLAQTEVIAATAELALGRAEAAEAALRRALAVDPALALDPATTSPKVLRALDAARARAAR
jgi:tetratricopeptide (TPR) repeat protein